MCKPQYVLNKCHLTSKRCRAVLVRKGSYWLYAYTNYLNNGSIVSIFLQHPISQPSFAVLQNFNKRETDCWENNRLTTSKEKVTSISIPS